MKKLVYLLTGASMLFATGCFQKSGTEITFESNFLEIEDATFPNQTAVVTDTLVTPTDVRNVVRTLDGVFLQDSIIINLVGRARTTDLVVTVDIQEETRLPANTYALQAGVHYTAPPSVTIPAGSNSAVFRYEVRDDALDPLQRGMIRFTISSTEVTATPNYATHYASYNPSCAPIGSNFTGSYNTTENDSFFGASTYTTTWTPTGPNAHTIGNFWASGAVSSTMDPCALTITVTDQAAFGGRPEGTGTVVTDTGAIDLNYTIKNADGSTFSTGTMAFRKP